MSTGKKARQVLLILGGLALVAAVVLVARGVRPKAAPAVVPVETAARRDIVVTIEATGTVEPIDLVEVKSKASGQILRMPVEVGSQVRVGQLLAQIDTNDVANQYAQSLAALRAAEAKAQISAAQKQRAADLFAEQIFTTDELESATIDYANAQSQLVTARTNLDIARQRRDDATIRAPISGTVLIQLVTAGQVISSATSSASGGTSLLKMADLSRIRLRVLVSESDIGKVKPGQTATVTVDAFPNRPFEGQVEKIEPQAVVQQSVTMFPVLVSISNEDRLLLPGMNGEVAVLIDKREGVLAVPLDAVRAVKELDTVAVAVGVAPDSALAGLERQGTARRAARAAAGAGGPRADSTAAGGRRRWTGNGAGTGPGADPAMGTGAGTGGVRSGSRANRGQFVFVQTPRGLEARLVRTGLSDYDYVEVLGGLDEGESVALLSVAEVQAKRLTDQARMKQRMGTGMPGVSSSGTTRSTGGARTGGARTGSGTGGARTTGGGR